LNYLLKENFSYRISLHISLLNFIDIIFGYIDPGTGTAIMSMIISAVVGFAVYVKLYWHKMRAKFAK